MDANRAALTRRAALVAAGVVPSAFLALFFVLPFAAIVRRGLGEGGGLSLPTDVWLSHETLQIVWFTTWQAAVSTVLTLAAGLPLAWAVGRFAFPGRALVRALVLVPFVLPTVVVATAFLALLPDGIEQGLPAILAAHVFFLIGFRNRFTVLINWAWAYWTYQRHARVVFGVPPASPPRAERRAD